MFKLNDWVSTGSTHLNICAIYSYLDRHQDALNHVELALGLLNKASFEKDNNSDEAKAYWNIKMLGYYNKAVEEEHLKSYEMALESYKQAKEVAKISKSKNEGIIAWCD